MRPVYLLLIFLLFIFAADLSMIAHHTYVKKNNPRERVTMANVVSALGITDLCISTEARYTRHPAVSDPLVPFMDHPGAIEHFPSGSFWAPPSYLIRSKTYEGILL